MKFAKGGYIEPSSTERARIEMSRDCGYILTRDDAERLLALRKVLDEINRGES